METNETIKKLSIRKGDVGLGRGHLGTFLAEAVDMKPQSWKFHPSSTKEALHGPG